MSRQHALHIVMLVDVLDQAVEHGEARPRLPEVGLVRIGCQEAW
jgi:hypothetical protein